MSKNNQQQTAEKVANVMLSNDTASASLGMRLLSVAPGSAELTMFVTPQHLNGHKICHGGFIFTLADTAFAIACNSYNQNAVAQHNSISFLKMGLEGETLRASAVEVERKGRSGIYDVTVFNSSDETIALFRGHSRTIKGTIY